MKRKHNSEPDESIRNRIDRAAVIQPGNHTWNWRGVRSLFDVHADRRSLSQFIRVSNREEVIGEGCQGLAAKPNAIRVGSQ